MNILILGGTVFLGRQLVETALAGGHQLTLFNRGRRNPELFPQVERLRGDRRGDLSELRGRRWDAVIDTCGYVPGAVRSSAEALRDSVDRYVFISSLSVYSDSEEPVIDESTPFNRITHEQVEEAEALLPTGPIVAVNYGEAYGGLKALCEEEAERAMPGRAINVRAGLIVGPHDYSDRFTYWPARVERGGEILAPGEPDRPKQLIDVRDVAEWIIRMLETVETGTFNVTGPDYSLSMKQLLEQCCAATNSDASFTWVADDFLLEQGVRPWTELPLWIPKEYEKAAFQAVNCDRAIRAGLSFRPLAETILDTLRWDSERPKDAERHAGLDPEKELRLLQVWKGREAQ